MSWLPRSPKARRRLWVVAAVAPILALAVGLSLWAMQDSVTFLLFPVRGHGRQGAGGAQHPPGRPGRGRQRSEIRRRRGGLFRHRQCGRDPASSIHGDLPDLFREGQGIVAQGSFGADRTFHASQVLAKHDENYMPREVADRLKEKGEWRPDGAPSQGAATKTVPL